MVIVRLKGSADVGCADGELLNKFLLFVALGTEQAT